MRLGAAAGISSGRIIRTGAVIRTVFVAGLRSFGTEHERGGQPRPRVVVVRRRAWLTRMVIAAARRLRHGRRLPRVH